jgi:hypothetical protein
VSYVCCELGHKIEVVELAHEHLSPLMLEAVRDGLLVGENDELTRFQHVSEMLHGLVDGQQLCIVGAVFLLSWAEFPGEEG